MRDGPARPEDLLAHADFVRGLARSLLYGEDGAEDVEQETWAAAMERPPRDPGAARSWLATVVRNFVRQRRRADAPRRVREEAVARPEGAPSTAEVLAREEQRRRVVEAVLALDAPRREVVLLRYFEALPPREIARRLGEPVETVRTRLKRALAELRERLDERRGGDRRAWALLLVPLARGAKGGGAGWAAGGLAMGAAAKAVAGVAAAALVAAAWWAWPREVPGPSGGPASAPPPAAVASAGPAETPVAPPVPVPAGPVFRGRVLDATSGEALAGARVRAFDPATDAPLGEAVAAEDGSFSLPAGEAARATLRLAAPGFEALERRGAAADASLTLRARRLSTLVLRVRDTRNDPVSGAEVAFWRDGALETVAVSDAEGTATAAGLVPGKFALGILPPATRTDLATASEKQSLAPGERREVPVALAEAAPCRGRVVDAETGNPIPGARITAVRGGQLVEWSSDGEGWFPFDHFPSNQPNWGSGGLVAAEGYETALFLFKPHEEREFTIKLRRAVEHRFRVLGSSGSPAAGIRVVAYSTEILPPIAVGESMTDDLGVCVISGFSPEPRHGYLLAASTADRGQRCLRSSTSIVLEREKTKTGATELVIRPCDRSLTMRLRRGEGAVEGVRVRVGWVPARREFAYGKHKGGPPQAPMLRSRMLTDCIHEGDSGPDGSLRFEGLPRGTFAVEIDGRSDRGWIASTHNGDGTLDIDLDEGLPEKFEVRGVVRTKDGPVNGAFVYLLDAEGTMGDGSVTYKEGRFQIETFRGPPAGLRLSLPEAGANRMLDFPLPPAGEEADLLVE